MGAMMMAYLAHRRMEDSKEQTAPEHLFRVGELMAGFAEGIGEVTRSASKDARGSFGCS